MRKYFLIGLLVSLMPNICLAYGPRYTQLVREKERKMAELEKCMGSTKGLKIAGVSTLGLTAAGVAGNIAEASAIKSYDKKIDKAKDDIKKAQKAVDEKDAELNNLKQQNQQPNQNQQGNAQASSANNQSNSECSDLANSANVVKAEKIDGDCKITKCDEGFKPDADGQSCEKNEEAQALNPTTLAEFVQKDIEKLTDPNTFNDITRFGHVQIKSSGYKSCNLSSDLHKKLDSALTVFKETCQKRLCTYLSLVEAQDKQGCSGDVWSDDKQITGENGMVLITCHSCQSIIQNQGNGVLGFSLNKQ